MPSYTGSTDAVTGFEDGDVGAVSARLILVMRFSRLMELALYLQLSLILPLLPGPLLWAEAGQSSRPSA